MSDEAAEHERAGGRDPSGPAPGGGQEPAGGQRREPRAEDRPGAQSQPAAAGRSEAADPSESGGRESGGRESDSRPVEGVQLPGASSAFMIMVLHLFTFLCCANWIFGPLGIVFAVRAAMSRDRGRYRQADTLVRYSWMCLGAGLVMLIVMVMLTVLLFVLGVPLLRDISNYQPY